MIDGTLLWCVALVLKNERQCLRLLDCIFCNHGRFFWGFLSGGGSDVLLIVSFEGDDDGAENGVSFSLRGSNKFPHCYLSICGNLLQNYRDKI